MNSPKKPITCVLSNEFKIIILTFPCLLPKYFGITMNLQTELHQSFAMNNKIKTLALSLPGICLDRSMASFLVLMMPIITRTLPPEWPPKEKLRLWLSTFAAPIMSTRMELIFCSRTSPPGSADCKIFISFPPKMGPTKRLVSTE